jgi:hypothetical protein
MSEPSAPDPFAVDEDAPAAPADAPSTDAPADEPAQPEDPFAAVAEAVGPVDAEPDDSDPFGAVADAVAAEAPDQDDVPEEIRQEVRIGGTDAGIATNDAMRALSRAARSFLLYEPRNQAIRDFLADYRENMKLALESFGTMELEIRPFEIVREGDVVYLERERERSLAFRLFRDGVRRLRIEPEVEWSELLRLLEILSIRYTGIRQQEDDIVTLLWKAGFKRIGIVAVEGFVPEEEVAQGAHSAVTHGKKRRRRKVGIAQVDAPEDWDLPLPTLAEPASLVYRDVDPERLAEIRQEASSMRMPLHAVRLVQRMLEVVADPADPTVLGDVVHLIGEVRDFLLSEGQLEYVVRLVSSLEERRDIDVDIMDGMLTRFSDARALRRILHSVGKAVEKVPPELISLLDMIPSDHVMHLTDLLTQERAPAARRITRMLIERYLEESDEINVFFERMTGEEPGVLCDMLRAASHSVPKEADQRTVAFAGHPASEVQLEVLWCLERFSDEELIEKTLLAMLSSGFVEVRIRVVQHLDLYGSDSSFDVLVEHAKHRAPRGMSHRECEVVGETLARLNPKRAASVMKSWVRPPGWFRRMVEMPGAQALQWTGVTGLGMVAGDDIDKLIRWLADRAGEELYKHCMMTLVRRRREGLGSA